MPPSQYRCDRYIDEGKRCVLIDKQNTLMEHKPIPMWAKYLVVGLCSSLSSAVSVVTSMPINDAEQGNFIGRFRALLTGDVNNEPDIAIMIVTTSFLVAITTIVAPRLDETNIAKYVAIGLGFPVLIIRGLTPSVAPLWQ